MGKEFIDTEKFMHLLKKLYIEIEKSNDPKKATLLACKLLCEWTIVKKNFRINE